MYTDDIITTIEDTTKDYVRLHGVMPDKVSLRQDEYRAYKEQFNKGNKPRILFNGEMKTIEAVLMRR